MPAYVSNPFKRWILHHPDGFYKNFWWHEIFISAWMCSVHFWWNYKQHCFRYKPRYGATVEVDKYVLDACAVACLPSKLLQLQWTLAAQPQLRWWCRMEVKRDPLHHQAWLRLQYQLHFQQDCYCWAVSLWEAYFWSPTLAAGMVQSQSSPSLFVRLHDNLHKVSVHGWPTLHSITCINDKWWL